MKALRAFSVLATLSLLLAAKGFSQTPQTRPAMPTCDGAYDIIRLSEITPTGSMEKFLAAVDAHQAWYASHGLPDIVVAVRVAERDPQTRAFSYSTKQMLTFHYSKPGGPQVAHDAAWDAYIKLYDATSSIKETTVGCVPPAAVPAPLK